MPPERDAQAVTRDWRQALRHIERAEPGSPELNSLIAKVQSLDDEYFGLRIDAFRLGRDLPPLPRE